MIGKDPNLNGKLATYMATLPRCQGAFWINTNHLRYTRMGNYINDPLLLGLSWRRIRLSLLTC